MNIKQFKVGDIITRNEGMPYKHNSTIDGSYTGDRIILKGLDETSKIIFFSKPDGFGDDILVLSYACDSWDEGWCYYPENLWQKLKGILKQP